MLMFKFTKRTENGYKNYIFCYMSLFIYWMLSTPLYFAHC